MSKKTVLFTKARTIIALILVVARAEGSVLQGGAWTGTEIANNSKVKVTVYYEALCPDSRHFLLRILSPVWLTLADFIHLELVPFGKAHISSDFTSISCHHGPPECKTHVVHACLMRHVTNFTVVMELLQCLMVSNFDDALDTLQECSESWPVDKEKVEQCVDGHEGFELMLELANRTSLIRPKIVPLITLDGKAIDSIRMDKNAFLNMVCNQIRRRGMDVGLKCIPVI